MSSCSPLSLRTSGAWRRHGVHRHLIWPLRQLEGQTESQDSKEMILKRSSAANRHTRRSERTQSVKRRLIIDEFFNEIGQEPTIDTAIQITLCRTVIRARSRARSSDSAT